MWLVERVLICGAVVAGILRAVWDVVCVMFRRKSK